MKNFWLERCKNKKNEFYITEYLKSIEFSLNKVEKIFADYILESFSKSEQIAEWDSKIETQENEYYI